MAIGSARYGPSEYDAEGKFVKAGALTGHDVAYEGAVLETRERNYHDDSDFYAIVWDEATQAIITVEYATTRFYTYDNYARVDATPEVMAKVEAYLERRHLELWRAENKRQAQNPAVFGKTVRVVKGRKVPVGTVGEVFWVGEQRQYGYRYYRSPFAGTPMRVGIRTADGTRHFLAADNVEVVGWEQYERDEETGRRYAAARAREHAWLTAIPTPSGAVVVTV